LNNKKSATSGAGGGGAGGRNSTGDEGGASSSPAEAGGEQEGSAETTTAGGSKSKAAMAAQAKAAAAASMGTDIIVITFQTSITKAIEGFLASFASKAATRAAADDIGKQARNIGDPALLLPISIHMITCLACDSETSIPDRKLLASLLYTMRTKAPKTPAPLVTDAQLGEAIETAFGALDLSGSPLVAQAAYQLLSEVVGLLPGGNGEFAKDRLPLSCLGELSMELFNAAPKEAAKEEEAEEEEAEEAAAAAAAEEKKKASAPAPASINQDASTSASAQNISELVFDVVESGRLGNDLLKAALSSLSAFKASDVAGPMMLSVLEVSKRSHCCALFFFLLLWILPPSTHTHTHH